MRPKTPVLAFDITDGLAWVTHSSSALNVTDLYVESRRHILVTALKLYRRVDLI